MNRLIIVSFMFISLCTSLAHAQQSKVANSQRRVALVIGNGNYAVAPLKNPVNDAHDIGQALRDLGFDVINRENVGQNDMKRAIREFGQKLLLRVMANSLSRRLSTERPVV